MEVNDYCRNDKSSTEEEETLLLNRLIALKKKLDDDEPKLHQTLYNTKENVINNKNVISSSKFNYRKVNNHVKFSLTKLDNRKNQTKIKQNNLIINNNNSPSKVYNRSSLSHLVPVKTSTVKNGAELVKKSPNIKKYDLEVNEILKNSHIKNYNIELNDIPDVSHTLLNIDEYMLNVHDYLTSSKYVVTKEGASTLLTNQTDNLTKNVHVNRQFQNRLISNSLLNSNLKSTTNALESIKKVASLSKKKPVKKLSGKCIESPNLIKIGNTKLICQSLCKNKWKINNKQNGIENSLNKRKPLSTLQYPTSNTIITSNNKTKWIKVADTSHGLKSKLSNSNISNKLKWTKPNILLVNNVDNHDYSLTPKSDKLILFGKNKIIRQSLLSSIQSKTKNYLLKHLSHRFALMRKLQQKTNVPKIKNITTGNEKDKNALLLMKTINKNIEIKRHGKRSCSMYSYVNPMLRSKTNNNFSIEKTDSTNIKMPHILTNNKFQQNLKVIKNKMHNLSSSNNKSLERFNSKKILTKQHCLVFNRFGVCPKVDQGMCDKRHYKKFITLCTKFLTGECFKENCTLSHNIVEEKIPFCKHYLNSVCVQLNCPYLHEYRDKNSPICKNFLHGYCILGKKCPKKHSNLCPIFDTNNKCPHGQKCLYSHTKCEEKNVEVEFNEPRYFEMTIPNNEESSENESIHIVPKRHAPLSDLPSYIPLKG